MSDLLYYNTLQDANSARQKEWDKDNKISNSYRGNEMAGEVGEALEAALCVIALGAASGKASNIVKKLDRELLGIRGSRANTTDLATELADVIICVHLIAMNFPEINLNREVALKFNRTSEANGLKTRLSVPI